MKLVESLNAFLIFRLPLVVDSFTLRWNEIGSGSSTATHLACREYYHFLSLIRCNLVWHLIESSCNHLFNLITSVLVCKAVSPLSITKLNFRETIAMFAVS